MWVEKEVKVHDDYIPLFDSRTERHRRGDI